MPPLLRHHRLVLLLVGMVALTRSTHGFVLVPSSSRSSFSDGRLAPSQASSTPSEGQASAPAPLTAEEGAKRRAALKGALLQSLVRSSAGAANELQGEDPVIACPVTLQPLTPEVRLAGPFGEVRALPF